MHEALAIYEANSLWTVGYAVVVVEVRPDPDGSRLIGDYYVIVGDMKCTWLEGHFGTDPRTLGADAVQAFLDWVTEAARSKLQVEVVDQVNRTSPDPRFMVAATLQPANRHVLGRLLHLNKCKDNLTKLSEAVHDERLKDFLRFLISIRVDILPG